MIKEYKEEFECTGIDHKYQILHCLNTPYIMVQLINTENGYTVPDNEYYFIRESNNTAMIEFKKIPIAHKKYTLLLLSFD